MRTMPLIRWNSDTMKTIPQPPRESELNLVTGLALMVVGSSMLLLSWLTDGYGRGAPSALGACFLMSGGLLSLLNFRRRRRKRKVR
jgi:peptidoglycan/LPS O-acetylase OafA/YrhL